MLSKKGCQDIYTYFNSYVLEKCKGEIKWENILNINADAKWWQTHHIIPFYITMDTKLQWFQYRVTHRILATNSYLKKIRYTESDLCTFCNTEIETIMHLLCNCSSVSCLWRDLNDWINEKVIENIYIQETDVILGNNNFPKIINLLILLNDFFFIYLCKMKKKIPRFYDYITYGA